MSVCSTESPLISLKQQTYILRVWPCRSGLSGVPGIPGLPGPGLRHEEGAGQERPPAGGGHPQGGAPHHRHQQYQQQQQRQVVSWPVLPRPCVVRAVENKYLCIYINLFDLYFRYNLIETVESIKPPVQLQWYDKLEYRKGTSPRKCLNICKNITLFLRHRPGIVYSFRHWVELQKTNYEEQRNYEFFSKKRCTNMVCFLMVDTLLLYDAWLFNSHWFGFLWHICWLELSRNFTVSQVL